MADYYVDNSGADGDGSFGSPWNNIAGHIVDLAAGDTMYIRGDVSAPGRIYTEHIDTSDGVNGTSANPITLQPYLAEHVVLKSAATEIVRLWHVDYWSFDDFIFDRDYVGSYAVYIRYGAHNTFRNCTLYDGDNEAFHLYQTDYNLIEDCIIYDFDAGPYDDADGVTMIDSSHNTVRNCTIYNIYGDCVLIGTIAEAVSGNIIEDNHLYTTLGGCSENAIDIKVGNPIIRRNVMHGFRFCDGSCGGSGSQGSAILLHFDPLGCVIEDNVIYDCTRGITVLDDDNVLIQRNLIYELVAEPGHLSVALYFHACDGPTVYNNTFDDVPDHLFYLSASARNIAFRNNLCHNTEDITVEAGGTYDADYNGWFNCTDTLPGAHDTTGDGDPGFKDAANDDYRLRRSSDAINAGVDVGLDFRGSAPDLGYKEHQGFVIASTWF